MAFFKLFARDHKWSLGMNVFCLLDFLFMLRRGGSLLMRFESVDVSSESLCHFEVLLFTLGVISRLSIVLLRREMSRQFKNVLASDSIWSVRNKSVNLSCKTSHLFDKPWSDSKRPVAVEATPTSSTKFFIVSHKNLVKKRKYIQNKKRVVSLFTVSYILLNM